MNLTFSRKELYNLVWSKSISRILEDVALTNTAFKNVCSTNNIPLPKSGHWQKVKYNKNIERTLLPPLGTKEVQIKLPKRESGEDSINQLSDLNLLNREIKNNYKLLLKVPTKLSKPEKITLATRSYYQQLKSVKYPYKVEEPKEGSLSISVSENLVGRALRFWDTFIKLLIQRGHKLEVVKDHKYTSYNGTKFVIYGEYFDMRLRETDKRVMEDTGFSWKTAKYYPTGKLSLKVDNYPRHEWQDSKTKLIEDKLSNILAYMEIWAKKRTKQRIEREIRNQEYEKNRKIEEELKQRRKSELEKFKSIINHSSRWQKAIDLRNYIKAVETNAIKNNTLTKELKNWLDWIKDKADWYDPLIEKDDELFGNIDRDSI